jgi:hypothetical protein
MTPQAPQYFYHVSSVSTRSRKGTTTIKIFVVRTLFQCLSPNINECTDDKNFANKTLAPEIFKGAEGLWIITNWWFVNKVCGEAFVTVNLTMDKAIEFIATHYPKDRTLKALLNSL